MKYSDLLKEQPKSRQPSRANTDAIREILQEKIITVIPETGKIFGPSGKELAQPPNFFGYPQIQVNHKGKRFKLFVHKVVWMSVHGEVPPNFEIDHIRKNDKSPDIANLRIIHWRENMARNKKSFIAEQGVF